MEQSMMTAINKALTGYLGGQEPQKVFGILLSQLIETTSTDYGMFAEVKMQDDGSFKLIPLAMKNLEWNAQNHPPFRIAHLSDAPLDAISEKIDRLLNHSEAVMENHLPNSHRFLGLPIKFPGELSGIVIIGSRHRDFGDQDLIQSLPLIEVGGDILYSLREERARDSLEDLLVEQTHLLSLTEKIARIGHWKIDLRTWNVTVSEEVYRLHDLEHEDYRPTLESITEFYHPDDRSNAESQIQEAIEKKGGFEFELRAITRKKRQLVIHSKGFCQLDGEGVPIALIGTMQDVTESRTQAELLKETQERYKLAIEGSSVGLWDWNVKTGELYCSPRFLEVLGLEEKDLIPKFESFVERIHPEDQNRILQALDSHLKHESEYKVEYRLRQGNGHHIWVRSKGQALWDQNGFPVRMAGSVDDITEQKLASLALQESEATLEEFHLITSDEALSLNNKIHSLLEMCNRHFKTRFALIGKIEGDRYTILHAISPDPLLAEGNSLKLSDIFCHHILQSKAPIGFKNSSESLFSLKNHFGSIEIEAFIGAPIFVDGKIYGTISFSDHIPHESDFSKKNYTLLEFVGNWIGLELSRERFQKNLHAQKEMAEMANRAKTAFIKNISHEIRTPMNGVIGLANLLADTPLDEKQAVWTNGIIDSANNLMHVVDSIIDITKIETGDISIDFKQFDLHQLIKEFASSAIRKAHKKNLDFRIHTSKDLPQSITSDKECLRKILENLFDNAFKFTSEGKIVLEAKMSDSHQILFSVSDTGSGIPEDKQAHIFDKFDQADSSSTRKYEGIGAGLAISKELTKLLGGDIGVESTPGKGSTFWFTIAREEHPAAVLSPYQGGEVPHANRFNY